MSATTSEKPTIPDPRQMDIEYDALRHAPLIVSAQRSAPPEQISIAGLRAELSRLCEQAGSQSAWDRKHGIERSVVSDTLSCRREPIRMITDALGFAREMTFTKWGEK